MEIRSFISAAIFRQVDGSRVGDRDREAELAWVSAKLLSRASKDLAAQQMEWLDPRGLAWGLYSLGQSRCG